MNGNAFEDTSSPIVRFAPAVRKGSHVLIALYGFSGCGKTLSAVYIARGLVGPQGKIAMIDTETGRGLIYASEAGGFDYAELTPPFTPERYVEAIKSAETAGYDVLILDSASHCWEGIGGIIDTAEASNQKGLVKWANPKARHKKFVHQLLNTRMHLLICMRAKEKLVQITANNIAKYPGTKVGDIVSEGFVSIQDKRFIYEMTLQLYLPVPTKAGERRGVPVIEKCPKDLLGAFPADKQISIVTGERIREWVKGGAPVDHALAALKQRAEEEAAKGMKALNAWWKSISDDEAARVKPLIPNLRSIAQEADAEAERQRNQPTTTSEPVEPAERGNPFDTDASGSAAGDGDGAPPSDDAADGAAPALPELPRGAKAPDYVAWGEAASKAVPKQRDLKALFDWSKANQPTLANLEKFKPDLAKELRRKIEDQMAS